MKKILFIVFVAAVVSSCGPKHERHEALPTNATEEKHDAPEDQMTLELNAGQKWQVNAEMMVHVRNMEKEILSFHGESLEEYHQLAEKIKNYIGELTSSCTMTGRSHEELHKWLHPFMQLSEHFSSSDSVTTARQDYDEIKKQMEIFNLYFE